MGRDSVIPIDWKRTRPYQTLKHWKYFLSKPKYRRADRLARADYERFVNRDGGSALRWQPVPNGADAKTALIVRNISQPYAKIEAWVMTAFKAAGYRTVVFGRRGYGFLRYEWLIGNRTGYDIEDFGNLGDESWINERVPQLRTLAEWLGLQYRNANVGRFVVASTLRALKVGQLDFDNPKVIRQLRNALAASIQYVLAGECLLNEVKPSCVLFMDRGYSSTGEISDLAISRGIDTITWNIGYKSNRLIFKRYNANNARAHPLAPSSESWRRMCAVPWQPAYGEAARRELLDCYASQDWFSVVGTQFDKSICDPADTRAKLDLIAGRKVVTIFPHILWDGSFFWGEDLFDDYAQWLIETLRAAIVNDRVQWVIKLHPAHVVKAKQVNDTRLPAELQLIEKEFGQLPMHVKLVHSDDKLSTYSLFQVCDAIVTVRGTVAMEAALFGIPAITAGTGRFDRRGFTIDSNSREQYLQRLATVEHLPRLTRAQMELAERYAYFQFFCRPLKLSCASLEFERDGMATPRLSMHCATRDELVNAPDMQHLAQWLGHSRDEDMLQPFGLTLSGLPS